MNETVRALVDTMLPGGGGFPSAASVGCAEWLESEARFRSSVATLADLLSSDFAGLSTDDRVAQLSAIEGKHAALFDSVTAAVYSAYYTRPAVLAALEEMSGYKATPPQPGGYELPRFDPAVLDVPRSRGSLWRDPDKELGS